MTTSRAAKQRKEAAVLEAAMTPTDGFASVEPELHIDMDKEFSKPALMVTYFLLYDKAGKAYEVMHAIDAREMLATGEYFEKTPEETENKKA
jgi:hypothetical protein